MKIPPLVQSIASDRALVEAGAPRHIDLLLRDEIRGPDVVNDADFFRMVTGEAHPLGNIVTLPRRDQVTPIASAIEPLRQGGFPSAVLFPEGINESARSAVLAAGFADSGSMPAMAADMDRIRSTELPGGYEWRRIGDGAEGEAWAAALAKGYGLPIGVARRFSPAVMEASPAEDAKVQFFAVAHEDRIVATSLLYLADGLAGIYCVATLSEERGRGLGAHVTAEALRVAGRLGYRVGVLQSSEEGHSVYRRLGFEDVGGVPMFVRVPA